MRHFFQRIICHSLLLLLSYSIGVIPTFAALAPDVTTLTSISSALSTPVRIASDSSGSLYVSDPRGGGIVQFASDGSYKRTLSIGGVVLGVAVAANGDILVSQGTSVAVYSASTFVKKLNFGTFGKANAITVANSGEIFVVDSLNNNVQVFNPNSYTPRNGAANSFGSTGTAPGTFRQPTGIAYEKVSGLLAITDTRNGRIQLFTTDGVYKESIGSFGVGPLKFTSPQSVTFEYSADQSTLKRIYVVDSFQSTIQVVDGTTHEFIRYIGSYGVTDGKLVTPSDCLFDKNSRLVVANGTGNLSLFGVADPTSGPYLQIDSVPQATNVSTITISGTTTGKTVTINGSTASISGTSWSGNITLVSGTNLITVVASDSTGSTTSKTVTVLAIAPSTNPVLLTVLPTAAQTSQALLHLSGTATSGATVTVNNAPVQVSGTSWNTTISLLSGANSLLITASKAGMSTSTIDLSVTLDTSVPVIATRLPSPGSVFSTPLQTLVGTVSSPNASTIILAINGKSISVPVSDGVFSIPFLLIPGTNNISIVAVDAYGATTQALESSVTYDPLAPHFIINSSSAAVNGAATYHLEGTVPAGSSVRINGVSDASVTGTNWYADVSLSPGINGFEITATSLAGVSSTALTFVAYSPGLPNLAITSPAKDSPVATANNYLSGIAAPGAVVTARVNGAPVSVIISASGAFTLAIPTMTTAGIYTVSVSVTDLAGATSTSIRSLFYDPVPPTITVVSATSPIKVSAPGGVLIAKDKNGLVGTVSYSGGSATLDLIDGTYDPTTLNIQALSPAGLSSRNGDLNLDGVVDIADALKALRILVGLDPKPTFTQMLRGDVGPVVGGEPTTDGRIRMSDIEVMLEKIIGLSSW